MEPSECDFFRRHYGEGRISSCPTGLTIHDEEPEGECPDSCPIVKLEVEIDALKKAVEKMIALNISMAELLKNAWTKLG